MDTRLTPYSGRVALKTLKGLAPDLAQATFTEGSTAAISAPLAPMFAAADAPPGSPVVRTLICGDAVTVIDRLDGRAFVQAAKDGYCGWVAEGQLGPVVQATHRVALPATHLYPEPRVRAPALHPLYLNARLQVTGVSGDWAETPLGHVPLSHLAPLDQPAADPVAVAETLLHAPYLWGGNSVAGVDCSGLVQLSLHAAGHACPGDSDQQRSLGAEIPEDAPLQRGDLLFWRGHVALVAAPDVLLHATAYGMRVLAEPLAPALARIAATGAPLLHRRRL